MDYEQLVKTPIDWIIHKERIKVTFENDIDPWTARQQLTIHMDIRPARLCNGRICQTVCLHKTYPLILSDKEMIDILESMYQEGLKNFYKAQQKASLNLLKGDSYV